MDNYAIEPEHWAAAERGMQRLMEIAHHRAVTFPDLLIAAIAEANEIGVLHYNHDFELLQDREIFVIYTERAAEWGTAD